MFRVFPKACLAGLLLGFVLSVSSPINAADVGAFTVECKGYYKYQFINHRYNRNHKRERVWTITVDPVSREYGFISGGETIERLQIEQIEADAIILRDGIPESIEPIQYGGERQVLRNYTSPDRATYESLTWINYTDGDMKRESIEASCRRIRLVPLQ